ncbi:MAG: hypothetical protein LUE92_03530 [Clostridiales bacterium]|nr:hypothetical protein [Clostridiales bacterium]
MENPYKPSENLSFSRKVFHFFSGFSDEKMENFSSSVDDSGEKKIYRKSYISDFTKYPQQGELFQHPHPQIMNIFIHNPFRIDI